MTSLQQFELGWIARFQEVAWLNPIMRLISEYSNELAWLLVPSTYLCLAPTLGKRLLIIYLFATGIIPISKTAFQLPRPYWVNESIQAYGSSAGFGMPSGHVLTLAAVLFFLAWEKPSRLLWWTASVCLLVLSASRVYLGVHFISDAVGGAVLALFIVLVYSSARLRILNHRTLGRRPETLLAFGCIGFLLLGGYLVHSVKADVSQAAKWSQFASSEFNWSGLIPSVAGLIASAASLEIARQLLPALEGLPRWIRTAQLLYGLAGLYVVEIGLEFFNIKKFGLSSVGLHGIEITVAVLWIILLVPWIFSRLFALDRSKPKPSDEAHSVTT